MSHVHVEVVKNIKNVVENNSLRLPILGGLFYCKIILPKNVKIFAKQLQKCNNINIIGYKNITNKNKYEIMEGVEENIVLLTI